MLDAPDGDVNLNFDLSGWPHGNPSNDNSYGINFQTQGSHPNVGYGKFSLSLVSQMRSRLALKQKYMLTLESDYSLWLDHFNTELNVAGLLDVVR